MIESKADGQNISANNEMHHKQDEAKLDEAESRVEISQEKGIRDRDVLNGQCESGEDVQVKEVKGGQGQQEDPKKESSKLLGFDASSNDERSKSDPNMNVDDLCFLANLQPKGQRDITETHHKDSRAKTNTIQNADKIEKDEHDFEFGIEESNEEVQCQRIVKSKVCTDDHTPQGTSKEKNVSDPCGHQPLSCEVEDVGCGDTSANPAIQLTTQQFQLESTLSQKQSRQRRMCPRNHILEKYTVEEEHGFGCSVCFGVYEINGTTFHGCRQCDYDICTPCFHNGCSAEADKTNAICDCYPDSIDIAEEEARYLRGRSPISLADVFIYSSRASTLARENESADAANMQQVAFQGVDTNQAIIKLHRGKATSSPSSTHAGEERRFDEDGNLYTLKEFIEFYGGDEEFRNSKTLFQVQAELELLAVNDALTTRSMRDHRERMFQSTSEITTPVAVGVATAAVVGTVATAAVAACAGALTGTVGAGVALVRHRLRANQHRDATNTIVSGDQPFSPPVLVNGHATASRRSSAKPRS